MPARSSVRKGGSRTAIGMIETKGLVPLAVAIEAMVKTTDVSCVAIDKIGDGYLAAAIVGGVAPVRYAMEAGVDAARAYGEVSSAQVYPQPHEVSRSVVEDIANEELMARGGTARLTPPKGA
jgi:ethanolamine utilization protein EutM